MRFDYDQQTDSLYIHFFDGAGSDTVVINDHVVADVDASGRLVGIDVQSASKLANIQQLVLSGFSPALLPTLR